MTIIRVEKKDNYSILPNAAINDKRLSLEARGLLVFLLSKPNDWQVNSRALTNISPAGRDKIRRILRELEQFGYLERRRFQGKDGKFVWESVVREQPLTESEKATVEENNTEAKEATAGENSPASPPEPEPETMVGFPVHGEPETMDGFSVDGLAVDGKPVPLINTELTNTERLNTRLSKATTTARLTRVPAGAAVAAADLPDEIRDALKALGWAGGMSDVAAAWQQDPERVRAWVEHAQRKRWSAALLRAVLREDPGYPPREPDPAERYLGDFAPDDAPIPDDASSPPEPPPDLPAPVRQWWQVVQGQLRREMPKAAFDAWVRDAYPLAFVNANGGGGVLTVAAANDYAREWLTERLTKTLERKLAGLAGKPVRVQFVVGEVSDA